MENLLLSAIVVSTAVGSAIGLLPSHNKFSQARRQVPDAFLGPQQEAKYYEVRRERVIRMSDHQSFLRDEVRYPGKGNCELPTEQMCCYRLQPVGPPTENAAGTVTAAY
ncbi:uncharacterized protein LOC129232064 [Uloborus diversus]|uniref:uncharacterized protein LOC129232064 n=1 Tax=Uloborus diversus TaxID=327109 RepID=UPI002409A70A|nr:uncharacterized protein LOC129232064 [Uloborus diversus]